MRLRLSYQTVMKILLSVDTTTPRTTLWVFEKFDATRRWDDNYDTLSVDFNTDEGYTQFLLTYGEYLK